MATNQAGIPVIMQGAVNPPINQNQQPVVVAQTIPKTFPVRTFKICGGLQIGCGILGIIGVVLDVIMMNTKCQGDTYCGRNKGLVTSEVIYMICSGWFIMTGFLPFCMSQKRENSWKGLTIGFMVCSILGASLIVPIVFIVGAIRVVGQYSGYGSGAAFIVLLLPFVELVLAIVSASCCCCCTRWGNQDQSVQSTVMFMNALQPGVFVNLPQTQIPMNYQPNVLMTTGQPVNPTVQYEKAQQYVTTTNQPLNIQQLVSQQPQNLYTDNPPAYTEN